MRLLLQRHTYHYPISFVALLSTRGAIVSSFFSKPLSTTLTLNNRKMSSTTSRSATTSPITGMEKGPFPIGVTTIQINDTNRLDPGNKNKCRSLQTEIWYPTSDASKDLPKNTYLQHLLGGNGESLSENEKVEILKAANGPKAIGGYRNGITVEELSNPTVWNNEAVRDAPLRSSPENGWPLIVFSHGYGAYRCSYLYWTEFLASHGFVVAACDHPGDARFTLIDGKPIVPGGERSDLATLAQERPKDVMAVLDGMEELIKPNSKSGITIDNNTVEFTNQIDVRNAAISGMSFGGDTITKVLEYQDARIQAAVLKCPAVGRYQFDGSPGLHQQRTNKDTPIMVMLGTEDTVLGVEGNNNARAYFESHSDNAYLMEIQRGGHVSFTSCELYDPEYGNGISQDGVCPMATKPGEVYKPLDVVKQHGIINSYGLAFLNTHLRNKQQGDAKETGLQASMDVYNQLYLQKNQFDNRDMDGEVLYRTNII